MRIRQEVQMFTPLPSHIAYPDILEEYTKSNTRTTTSTTDLHSITTSTTATTATTNTPTTTTSTTVHDIYQTWYPPMRHTLSLLSKLYGVVEHSVFDDFARRAINLCISALRKGSDGIRRAHPGLHADLFLVRHLLMLREQLSPFELKLTSLEKKLDFTSTTEALQALLGMYCTVVYVVYMYSI